ncbi:vWA domain-containing protein [uncultured Bifidobacterium sp.]|uniref:vWA domain-containing protein n=1 Tax=uncultured Bifidobacterium sp. TaxID=165187 RepID=UPI0025865CB9|nr:vWA domain-containing protein [uncultured Bifidobacterium sp.]
MRRIRRFEGKHGSDEPRAESGRRKSRLVAAFVAVAMTVGLAGAGVAAYGEDTTDQSQSATTAAQDATAAAEGVDAPQYAKRISKNDDGTYTLSMDVTGKSSESTEQQVVPLDIALVLDVSGSMDEPIGDGSSTTRLQALQTAVTSFLSQVEDQNQRINDNTKKVQVALIKYAGNNSNTIGNEGYCSVFSIWGWCLIGEWRNYSQTVHSLAWEPEQLQQERDAVNALHAGGATRADFGLQHAVTQLNSGVNSGRPGAQKLTIFYSDGSPTSSDGFETTVADAAIRAAAQLKAGTSQVISIGAMSGANPDGTDNANKFMNYVSSNYPDAQSMSEPGARGEGTYYYAVSASTNLQTIFDKIISMVTSGTAYQDVTMTDTLSNYVEFSHPDAQNFGAELVIRDKDGHTVDPSVVGLAGYTITAHPESKTISISFPQGYALKDGYTYSLEYTIVPSAQGYEEYAANVNAGKNGYGENPSVGADDTGVSSAGQQGFLSNERATIGYRPRVNGEPQDLVEGTEYPHPVIQVDTTQFANLSIHKAWIATNPEPDKVTVDVTCKDAAGGECTGYPGIDISKSSNWTSTVLIPKADADRTYTVTEHALSGFRTYYTNREITIPADTAGEYRSTVTNYPVAINFNLNQIRVGKTVQGTDTNQDFTFTLSPVNAEGAVAGDKPFTGAELTLDDRFTNGTQVTGAFADTSITLPTPEAGQEATYTFNIAENAPSPSAGWAADTDAVTVITASPYG